MEIVMKTKKIKMKKSADPWEWHERAGSGSLDWTNLQPSSFFLTVESERFKIAFA